MERNPLFPIFLKLEDLRTLLVGGGAVALEKLQAILKNSPKADITLIGRSVLPEIKELIAKYPTVKYEERNVRLGDLWKKDLLILATNDRDLHQNFKDYARSRHLLTNVADTPDLCDFYLGSVVTKGNLKIGISTNGKSPTIAKRMREYLEEALPEETNDLLDNMNSIREKIKGDLSEKVKALNAITGSWLKK